MASLLLIASPVGPLELTADRSALTAIRFAGQDSATARGDALPARADRPPGATAPIDRAPTGSAYADSAQAGVEQADNEQADNGSAEAEVLAAAARQLAEYFAGTRTKFDLPLLATGTGFQRSVWDALAAIPYGERASYAQIAADVGRPRAGRAVGAACRGNPLPIVVPCHRVIGSDGSLTGYAGGTQIKKGLLELEDRTLGSRGQAGEAGPGR